jgi:parvulin-like peptidyl-prolyl isomerase
MAPAMRKPTIFAAFLCLGAAACQGFTAGEVVSLPDPSAVRSGMASAKAKATAALDKAKPAAPAPVEADSERVRKAHEGLPGLGQQQAKPADTATASHLLIRYVGTMRAGPEVTRSKAEAEKLAKKALAEAKKKGANFAEIADRYTEDPSGKGRGGKLGTFPSSTPPPSH